MHSFSASGGREKSRCSPGLPINARGVGWLDFLRRLRGRTRVVQYLLLMAGVLVAYPAGSETVTLAWDGASDPDVAGYRLHYGSAPRTYSFVIDVGLANSCSVSNINPDVPHFFAVTAYSHLGAESDYSSEIVHAPGLQIAAIFADDYGTVLIWPSQSGAFYRVLATQTLTDPVWVDVSGPLLGISTARLWTHMRTPGRSSMFYRVEALFPVR